MCPLLGASNMMALVVSRPAGQRWEALEGAKTRDSHPCGYTAHDSLQPHKAAFQVLERRTSSLLVFFAVSSLPSHLITATWHSRQQQFPSPPLPSQLSMITSKTPKESPLYLAQVSLHLRVSLLFEARVASAPRCYETCYTRSVCGGGNSHVAVLQ